MKELKYKYFIQIWSCTLSANPTSQFLFGVAHGYGSSVDLKWCPEGGRNPTSEGVSIDLLWKHVEKVAFYISIMVDKDLYFFFQPKLLFIMVQCFHILSTNTNITRESM